METCEVLFQPDGLSIRVARGTLITEAMKKLGIEIQLPCGGAGTCGKCVVEIHPEAPEPGDFDRFHLTENELQSGKRLACQTRIDRDMSVLITSGMRVLDGKILVDGISRSFVLDTAIAKTYMELPEPTLEDQAADLYRVKRALNDPGDACPEFDIDLIRELPKILRDANFKVTVVTSNGKVVAVEPGDTTERIYGMAFDIGTTTVVGTIVDLRTGSDVARASRLNAQVVYGEDTISRIQHAITHTDGRTDMMEKIRNVINDIIREAAENAGITTDDIYEAVFVGNTTMSHLLLGFDPYGLSRIPFVPVANAGVNLRARDAGIVIHPNGNLYVLPNIAGFVGSDTVGVMLACDYLEDGPAQLAVDVGTNGELSLRRGSSLIVCSTAAGPALEGAAITCGMRAAGGAIEHVRITPDRIECDVIGGTAPSGLCGSGIIDLLAQLLELGIVDRYGAILDTDHLKGKFPDYLLDHIVVVDDQPAFVVIEDSENGVERRKIVLTQRDIRQIQLAKGAISAGIRLILKEMSMKLEDLDEILLAGAFGNYINKENAQRIGLLPDISPDRIRFVGNAASTGAKMALLSREVRRDADTIRHKTRHLELANLPGFMDTLTDCMLFP